ncbi:copper resistance protein CopC [Paenibacillus hodogayensis]|uniref:Copper resistance protein CopC n=1 Tax=Paenibacillus hodogayensis TaxID=279208 RepID=A0ABV5W247_9BACL
MKNQWRIGLMTIMLLLAAPFTVSAHTALKSSVPAGGASIEAPLHEITMEFNTDVESLSTFEVRNARNEQWKVTGIKADKSKLSGKLEQTLPDGDYTVTCKIVGRDGHPVENTFSFSVKLAQSSADAAQAGGSAGQNVPTSPATAPEESGGRTTPIVVLVVLLAAVFASTVLVLRKRKGGRTS